MARAPSWPHVATENPILRLHFSEEACRAFELSELATRQSHCQDRNHDARCTLPVVKIVFLLPLGS